MAADKVNASILRDALGIWPKPVRLDLPSRQCIHLTLWGYPRTGLTRGMWGEIAPAGAAP